jgi:hypothetical protein
MRMKIILEMANDSGRYVPCEICGNPASEAVVDLIEGPPENDFRQWEAQSRHFFCSEHARPSIEYPLPVEPLSERVQK